MALVRVHCQHDGQGVAPDPLARIGRTVPKGWVFHSDCTDHEHCFVYEPRGQKDES